MSHPVEFIPFVSASQLEKLLYVLRLPFRTVDSIASYSLLYFPSYLPVRMIHHLPVRLIHN